MKIDSKNLGVLGLGSLSTTFYIQSLNAKYLRINGGYSSCPFLMLNADFNLINPYLPNNFEKLNPVLLAYLNTLNDLGTDRILLPNITLHEAVEVLKLPYYSKIIHPIDISLSFLQDENIQEVVLFGTIFTMNSSYFQKKLESKNVQFLKPNKADQERVDALRKKVYENKMSAIVIAEFNQLVQKYSKDKVVLIACTELSMIPKQMNSDKVVDMVDLQINNALIMT
ncbi:hypothetical protein DNU06_13165 [Putridiphycobacter roseus]|uniref:Aspartate racemase n=1 Tax=Putridiphycobacter roseus TaxID=2219161 RepID=A0A2W1MZ23_9FLAO|nr:aspartate/glutamate racemase family protein [Putridiphycobacter roseus]PZE16490.1 hypothetical protein DNU06_13165 [Putridiphycobacter roseus]